MLKKAARDYQNSVVLRLQPSFSQKGKEKKKVIKSSDF
jgi:hypothetical protein